MKIEKKNCKLRKITMQIFEIPQLRGFAQMLKWKLSMKGCADAGMENKTVGKIFKHGNFITIEWYFLQFL